MKKKIILMLCMIACLTMITGCSLTRVNENLKESKVTKLTEDKVNEWFSMDYQQIVDQVNEQGGIEIYEAQYSKEEYTQLLEMYNEYKDYAKQQKKYGGMKKILKKDYSLASSSASVSIRVLTNNDQKIVFTSTYDKNGEETDFKIENYQSVKQIMGKAALNTVMSMGIVFCVLIAIALLISCFKFIGMIQNKQATAEAVPAPVVEAAPVAEENLVDDLELVAVITAAIAAASENESADGLVVRSIVRR